jgi:hypothetical protein
VAFDRALTFKRRADGVAGFAEGKEESVSFGAELDGFVLRESVAEKSAMGLKELGVAFVAECDGALG